MKRHLYLALGMMAALLTLDQATKIITDRALTVGHGVSVIPGLFNYVHVRNTGAAWGMLSGHGWLLLSFAVVAFSVLLWKLDSIVDGWPERYYAVFAIISGIVGNSIDRICRGSVVDFLDFHLRGYHWPAFNVADISICVGVGIFILSSLTRPVKKENGNAGDSGPDGIG